MPFPILADLETKENRQTQVGDRRLFANLDRLSEKLTSGAAVRARALYEEIQTATTRIASIEAEGRDWEKRVAEANAKITAAVQKDATDAGDGEIVVKATAESYAAKAALDPSVWRRRLLAAGEGLRAAEADLRAHLNGHAADLIRELESHDIRIAKDLTTARAKAQKLLDGPQQESREITRTLETVIGQSDLNAEQVFAAHRQTEPDLVAI